MVNPKGKNVFSEVCVVFVSQKNRCFGEDLSSGVFWFPKLAQEKTRLRTFQIEIGSQFTDHCFMCLTLIPQADETGLST